MAEFKAIKDQHGTTRYMKDGKLVAGNSLPPDVRQTLGTVDPGTRVDEDGNIVEDGDGIEGASKPADPSDPALTDADIDEDGPEDDSEGDSEDDDEVEPGAPLAPTPAAANKVREARTQRPARKEKLLPGQTPQSDPGMGFPRVKGKTVDIFDGKTPHTHVRLVRGVMVPLSQVNYEGDADAGIAPKTEAEILDKLKSLGMF